VKMSSSIAPTIGAEEPPPPTSICLGSSLGNADPYSKLPERPQKPYNKTYKLLWRLYSTIYGLQHRWKGLRIGPAKQWKPSSYCSLTREARGEGK
jgi:hypothetical protein